MPAVPLLRTWSPGELANATLLNANVRDPVKFYRQRPMFLGYRSNLPGFDMSLANDTWTVIPWDGGELVDTENGYSGTGGVITIIRTGLYDVRATALFETNTTGGRALKIERTTPAAVTTVIAETGMISSCSTDFPGIANVETTVRLGDMGYHLDAGDTVQMYGRQTSGGTLHILGHATEQYTWLNLLWVAAT